MICDCADWQKREAEENCPLPSQPGALCCSPGLRRDLGNLTHDPLAQIRHQKRMDGAQSLARESLQGGRGPENNVAKFSMFPNNPCKLCENRRRFDCFGLSRNPARAHSTRRRGTVSYAYPSEALL